MDRELIATLQSAHSSLVAEREMISASVAGIESALRALEVAEVEAAIRPGVASSRSQRATPSSRAGAGNGEGTVEEHIRRVLGSEPMRRESIARAILSNGYETRAAFSIFRGIVGHALRKMPDIRIISRGIYAMK